MANWLEDLTKMVADDKLTRRQAVGRIAGVVAGATLATWLPEQAQATNLPWKKREPVTSGSQVVMAIQTPIAGASHRQKVPQPVDVIAIVRKLRTVLAHPSVKRDMSASQQMAALVVAPCLECVSLNVRASTRIANWGMGMV